ncbi:MAG: response regulator [Gemmatimonadetes bacterium]|nr:response regulator [Gemmatimonadota bacterium]
MAEKSIEILLIESDLAHVELIRRSFEEEEQPVRLSCSQSLGEAHAHLIRSKPDIAIVNWVLPDGEGGEFLNVGEKSSFPVVIMTSQGDEQVAVQAMKAGALDYVVKSETTLAAMPRTVERAMREWDHIVQRKQVEKALQESEIRLNSIIKSIPDIIYRLDPEGKITFISDAVKKYGYEPEDLLGVHISELVHPGDREKARYRLNERRTGSRSTRSLEVRLLKRDRRAIDFEIKTTSFDDAPVLLVNAEGIYFSSRPSAEGLLGTQGVARDITERKQLEEQLLQSQKMEAIGQLAGGIAHDFNNMLMAILTTCDFLILTSDADDPKRQEIELIKEAGERAANLTQQILAFSRRQVQRPEVLDLNEVIGEMHKMLRRLIGENIELVRRSNAELGKVNADRTQIVQIIMNLALNARDAMPRGGKLCIDMEDCKVDADYAFQHPTMQPGAYVKLTVSDTGEGIDAETRAHIFEPFFTTKEVGLGTGMGLPTVFGIVKQSGGFIWVDSEREKGTAFQIFLPRIEEEVGESGTESILGEELEGSETVLLVEDDGLLRKQVQRMLSRMGYRVLEAQDGEEALACCAQNGGIDLLLTDVVMPGMSGKELADRLSVELSELKVIYMSGYTDEMVVGHGVPQVGGFFMPKPFNIESLASTVRQALDG